MNTTLSLQLGFWVTKRWNSVSNLEALSLEVDTPVQESTRFHTTEPTASASKDDTIPTVEESLLQESIVEVKASIPHVGPKVTTPTVIAFEPEELAVDSFEDPV